MKRRFICFLMSALLLLSILPYSALPAFAEDSLSGVCGDNLTWSFNPDTGALTIEGSGAMEDYRFSGYAPWYSYRNAIRSLSLPYGLTGIGNLAFYGCKSLTTVDFPESVTRIGEYAFYRCSGLTDVVLPAGLTTLELRVFNDCTQLRSVVLPAGLSAIQNEAFLGCSKLSQVDLSGTSVTSIGDQAFLSCKSLTAMNLPASLTSIGYRAFSICPSLTAFSVPADNPSFSTDSRGVLLNKAQTALIQYPIGNPASSYLMPDSVVTVREYAFENSKNLLSVHFAANLTDIGDFAFFGCSNFSSVVLPAGLRSIGGKAFSQCSSMTSINFPASLTTIGASAFMSCGSLTAADLSETSVTSIELYTFLYCGNLTELSLPECLTTVGKEAFYGSPLLTSVTLPAGLTRIGDSAFGYITGFETSSSSPVENFTIYGYSGTAAETYASDNGFLFVPLDAPGVEPVTGVCGDNLTWSFDAETGLLTIEGSGDMYSYDWIDLPPWYEFRESILALSLPDGITSIGDNAFYRCTNLGSIEFPEGLRVIGHEAFCGCKNLYFEALPASLTVLSQLVFFQCEKLTAAEIPSNVSRIQAWAFAGCTGLSSVTIPAGVTSIEDDAFFQCDSVLAFSVDPENPAFCSDACGVLFNKEMTELIQYPAGRAGAYSIPGGVTEIRDCAFADSAELDSVNLPDSLTSIGMHAFINCPSLGSVVIPAGVTDIQFDALGTTAQWEYSYQIGYFLRSAANPASVDGFTIYGFTGTAAQSYAEHKSFLFVPLDGSGVEPVTGVCGDNLTWSFDAETGLLTINGSGDMWDFDEYFEYDDDYGYEPLFAPWHSFNDSILALSLPEGLSSIGNSAFQNCFALEEVHVPEGVTRIGASAFASCSSLSHLELPIGLEIIDSRSFENCASLTGVELPEGLSELGHSAFSLCCGLSSIGFPDSLRVIGPFAFYGCGLTELSFPAGLTSIGDVAFGCCDNLTAAIIPAGLTSFGEQPFFACDGIDAFAVAEGNTCFRVDEAGVLFNASMTQLLEYPSGRSGAYEIPEGVVSVANRAFDLCKLLTGIRFPDSLTSIGDSSFLNCSGLTELMFPANLTEVGDWAFRNCTGLTAVSFPGSLQSVGYKAFLFCPELIDLYYGGSAAAWAALKVDLAAQRKHYNVGNPADHWVSDDQLPTCTEDGLHRASCPCGYEIEPAPIPAFGHDFADGVCTRCGKLMTAADIFSDVDENAYYAPAVLWAAQNGITSGTGNGTFSPKLTCTREQIVTFLWNAAGKPAPAIAECRFSDVVSGRYYYDAVLWAVENGITNGVSSTSFGVGRSCTREQLVTFLWNAAGKPEPMNTECPFSDVARGKYYYIPVLWAYENGITAGIGEGAFGVGKSCTRAEAVTFLYTAYHP